MKRLAIASIVAAALGLGAGLATAQTASTKKITLTGGSVGGAWSAIGNAIGETIRRIGLGQWRYGADLEADDPRSKQPYIRLVIGDQNLDLVPWKLAQAALEDSEAIAKGLDTVIEMREEEAAGASSSSDGTDAPADKDTASES